MEFLESIRGLPIRLADPVSYDGLFSLADRHGLTVYDAAYLDLAIREGLPLASLDKRSLQGGAQFRRGIIPAVTVKTQANQVPPLLRAG